MEKTIKCFEPNFYKSFRCTGGDCPITCCGEWRIAVDDETEQEWESLSLAEAVEEDEAGFCVRLAENGYCPYLNADGLCKVVIDYGEETLSETCHVFPRQTTRYLDRMDRTIVSCCPAAVDILANCEHPQILEKEELVDCEDFADYEPSKNRLMALRSRMMERIADREYSVDKSMQILFYRLLEDRDRRGGAKQEEVSDKKIAETIDSMTFHAADTLLENNELFSDMIANYLEQGLYESYLEPIAEMAEEQHDLLESNPEQVCDAWKDFAKSFLQYDSLIRNYLWNECFGNLCNDESTLDKLILRYEWITMEYAAIRYALYLNWLCDERALSYERVRKTIVLISRMTGYDDADVEEYLEGLFNDPIWEWGYYAMMSYMP